VWSSARRRQQCSYGPAVGLACGDVGEPGEGGLADAGAGEQGGERGVQERSYGAPGMEFTSIMRSEMASVRRHTRDKRRYRAWWNSPVLQAPAQPRGSMADPLANSSAHTPPMALAPSAAWRQSLTAVRPSRLYFCYSGISCTPGIIRCSI
jgi:hypothetical protein